MRRVLLFLAVVTVFPIAVFGQLPPVGSIGLYAEALHQYNAYCPFPEGYPIAKAEMWVWCLPSTHGLKCAEFAIAYPSNVMRDRITYNPLLSSTQGDLLSGFSACMSTCRWDWCWIVHQTLYVTSRQASYAEIIPHPGVGLYRFFNCDSDVCCYEPCLRATSLYFNNNSYPCVPPELAIQADESTWGAVKDLFGE